MYILQPHLLKFFQIYYEDVEVGLTSVIIPDIEKHKLNDGLSSGSSVTLEDVRIIVDVSDALCTAVNSK